MSRMESDRDPGHADVTHDPGVVRVVAPVGREVEGDGQPLLASGEVAPVERVGLLGRAEARVLADGPGAPDVHGRVRPAIEGCGAGDGTRFIGAVILRPSSWTRSRSPPACSTPRWRRRRGPCPQAAPRHRRGPERSGWSVISGSPVGSGSRPSSVALRGSWPRRSP